MDTADLGSVLFRDLQYQFFKEMTGEKRFINFRLDRSHVTSRATQFDVIEFKNLPLTNSNNIV